MQSPFESPAKTIPFPTEQGGGHESDSAVIRHRSAGGGGETRQRKAGSIYENLDEMSSSQTDLAGRQFDANNDSNAHNNDSTTVVIGEDGERPIGRDRDNSLWYEYGCV